jgi:hypothetical protein
MSGGGGGNQSVTQEFKPPEYTKEGWKGYLDSAITLKDRPYEQSGLPQVATWGHTARHRGMQPTARSTTRPPVLMPTLGRRT